MLRNRSTATSSTRHHWQRSNDGISLRKLKVLIGISLSLIVMILSLMVVGFLHTCGRLENRIPQCSIHKEQRHEEIWFLSSVRPRFSSSASSSKTDVSIASYYFCNQAWDLVDKVQISLRNFQRNASESTTTSSCQPPSADVLHHPDDVPPKGEKSQQKQQHALGKLLHHFRFHRKRLPAPSSSSSTSSTSPSSLQDFPSAFTRSEQLVVSESKQALVRELSHRVQSDIPNFRHRAAQAAWGGPGGPKWYYPIGDQHYRQDHHVLDTLDGGWLLFAYLRIMNWPRDLHVHFPFQLCAKGCDAQVAIGHTLEFREKFQPWHITPAAIYENRQGFIYHRGYSPTSSSSYNKSNNKTTRKNQEGKHAVVWFRPGIHKREDSLAYLRAMIYTFDHAIADSLRTSGNTVGKFNAMIDTHGFSFSMIPRLWEVKQGIKVLQDHLPDRLGMVFLMNLSHPAELALNVVKPFLTKEVRDKICIVPHDLEKKRALLRTVIEPNYIPTWLGGSDDYQFDPDTYYPQPLRISNQQGLEYLRTMPYHAH
jgi:hypothetical protein